jgi:hypothetical protein
VKVTPELVVESFASYGGEGQIENIKSDLRALEELVAAIVGVLTPQQLCAILASRSRDGVARVYVPGKGSVEVEP